MVTWGYSWKINLLIGYRWCSMILVSCADGECQKLNDSRLSWRSGTSCCANRLSSSKVVLRKREDMRRDHGPWLETNLC